MARSSFQQARRFLAVAAALTALGGVGPAGAQSVKFTDVVIPVEGENGMPGALIAADVYMPPGWALGSPRVPCLVEATPYRKENRATEGASFLPQNGFGLVEVDVRGTGASTGNYNIVFSLTEQRDVAQVIDWAGTPSDGNPYCTSTVGMFGGSYSGIIQYLVATLPAADPLHAHHLAAIAPMRAYGDLYRDIVFHGGMAIASFGAAWSAGTTAYYTEPPRLDQVPADQNGINQVASAWSDHLQNRPLLAAYLQAPFADAVYNPGQADQQMLYADSSALSRLENLTVPALHLAGFYDAFTRGQLLLFEKTLAQERADPSVHGPNYLIVGPWNHGGTHFSYYPAAKQKLIDFYNHYLGGAPAADWMSGPRVEYFQDNAALAYFRGVSVAGQMVSLPTDQPDWTSWDGSWESADSWPPSAAQAQRLYLAPGMLPQSGTLSATTPAGDQSLGILTHEPSQGFMETDSRWDDAAGLLPEVDRDQRPDEIKGVSFTIPLTADFAVAGPIGLNLNAKLLTPSTTAPTPPNTWAFTPPVTDFDLVAKVSDVGPDGTSTLITQGYLRASEEAYDPAQSQYLGGELVAPYHLHTEASTSYPQTGAWKTYHLEIWPTAKTWKAGHSLRLTLYLGDFPNHFPLAWPATVELGTDPLHPSYLVMPSV